MEGQFRSRHGGTLDFQTHTYVAIVNSIGYLVVRTKGENGVERTKVWTGIRRSGNNHSYIYTQMRSHTRLSRQRTE